LVKNFNPIERERERERDLKKKRLPNILKIKTRVSGG